MQEIRLIYRNSNSKDFRQPEEMHMKEQQEKIRVLDPHIILILFISAFVFIRHRNADDFPGKKGNRNRGI